MAKVAILINAPTTVNQSQFTYLPKGRWIIEMINVISAKLIIRDPSTLQFDIVDRQNINDFVEGPATVAATDIVSNGPVSIYAVPLRSPVNEPTT